MVTDCFTDLLFSFDNPADFLPSEVLGASCPGSDCISLAKKKENSRGAQVSGFSWQTTAGHGHVAIFWGGYKGRETIIDQGEKTKQAKFPKPGFHELPQEWGLFSVWFPTRQ